MKNFPSHTPRALEEAARFHDIQQRAKAASPVSTGRDILRAPVEGLGGLCRDPL